MASTDYIIRLRFVLFPLLALALQLQFTEQSVPVVVVGAHPCLVHQADGGGALVDGGCVGGIVVLALAPCAAAGHLALQTLGRALCGAVECQEGAQLVLVDAVTHIADDDGTLLAQRVGGKAGAGIEHPLRIHRQHLARTAPVLVLQLGVERLADVLAEERAGIVLIPAAVDDVVGQLHELLLEQAVIALAPHVLEHTVDVHLVDAQAIEVQHALADVGDVGTADGDLGTRTGELLQPQRDVAHHVVITAALQRAVTFIDTVQVVLLARAVDGDADAQVRVVLGDELLYTVGVIVDAVGRERETVAVEPVVVQPEHLGLEIVANLVDQFYLQKRLATDKVPHHALLGEVLLVPQDIVDSGLGRLPRHPLLLVLAHQVAILASQLAVLRYNKRDVLGNA